MIDFADDEESSEEDDEPRVSIGEVMFCEMVDNWLDKHAATILLDRAYKCAQKEKKEEKKLEAPTKKGCLVHSNANRNNLKKTRK